MDMLNSAVKGFDNTVNSWMSFIDRNDYISAVISLVLILYAGLAAPKLPEYIAKLFDNVLFKLVIFFLIAYSAKKNPTVAIIASVGLMVSLQTLNKLEINKYLAGIIRKEEAMEAVMMTKSSEHDMDNMMMEERSAATEEQLPEETLAELQENAMPTCTKEADFRNSFYPQYANMKPDAYLARYTGDDVGGYDTSARYSGSNGRSTYDSNRGSYNGDRGSYN